MLSGLRSLQVFPTFRCNQACGFCFNRGLAGNEKVDAQQYAQLIGIMSDFGIPELDMLGGEPTLLPHLCDRIGNAVEKGIRVNISSNGSNVPVLTKLAQRFSPGQITIGVSVNDELLSHSLAVFINACRPALKSICSREQTLPDSIERYLDLPRIDYHLIFMDALRPGDLDYTIPYPEYRARLAGLQREHENVHGVVCGGFVPDLETSPELAEVRCPAGTTKLSIMPDGSVYPCYLFFRHPMYRLGNIFSDSPERIIAHPILDFFRTFQGNPCEDAACEYHAGCHGGCPAVSLLLTGNIAAPDPRCRQS